MLNFNFKFQSQRIAGKESTSDPNNLDSSEKTVKMLPVVRSTGDSKKKFLSKSHCIRFFTTHPKAFCYQKFITQEKSSFFLSFFFQLREFIVGGESEGDFQKYSLQSSTWILTFFFLLSLFPLDIATENISLFHLVYSVELFLLEKFTFSTDSTKRKSYERDKDFPRCTWLLKNYLCIIMNAVSFFSLKISVCFTAWNINVLKLIFSFKTFERRNKSMRVRVREREMKKTRSTICIAML